MAYFAKLGVGNIVTRVTCVNDDIATSEQAGVDFLDTLHKTNNVWKQTYIDGSQRKNYAGVDYSYNEELDAFIPPKYLKGWVLNETTCQWEAPVAMPNDGKFYDWNESTKSWDERVS